MRAKSQAVTRKGIYLGVIFNFCPAIYNHLAITCPVFGPLDGTG